MLFRRLRSCRLCCLGPGARRPHRRAALRLLVILRRRVLTRLVGELLRGRRLRDLGLAVVSTRSCEFDRQFGGLFALAVPCWAYSNEKRRTVALLSGLVRFG